MASYVNTLVIRPQDDAASSIAAMAEALSGALDWELLEDGVTVRKPGTVMCFRFMTYNSSSVYVSIGNESIWLTFTSGTTTFNSSYTYSVDYIVTSEGTVAAGVRRDTEKIQISTIMAENTVGETVAIRNYSNLEYFLRPTWSGAKSQNLGSYVSTAGCSTSLVKYPDIFGGCMFKDVYFVMSCPDTSTDKVLYAGGKYYQYISSVTYGGLALPVS